MVDNDTLLTAETAATILVLKAGKLGSSENGSNNTLAVMLILVAITWTQPH